jgi:CheY-like chemotaxis protein
MKVPFTSQSDERLTYSSFFRAVNDDIVALSAHDHDGALQILCECSRRECATTLRISADEYKAVRADGTRYLMTPGHERTEIQRVVLRYGAIAVVQQRESWVESHPLETEAAVRRARPLVLVVDDEPGIRDLCSTCLQSSGFVVLGASDGQQGLDQALSLLPDLVITDVSMPVLDGFRLAQALGRDVRTHDIPVIFLSGETDRAHVAEGLDLGALAYITKPFDPAVFTSVTTGVLARFAGVERSRSAMAAVTPIRPLNEAFLQLDPRSPAA